MNDIKNKIDSFFNSILTSKETTLIFFVVVGIVSVMLIIIIAVTVFKSKREKMADLEMQKRLDEDENNLVEAKPLDLSELDKTRQLRINNDNINTDDLFKNIHESEKTNEITVDTNDIDTKGNENTTEIDTSNLQIVDAEKEVPNLISPVNNHTETIKETVEISTDDLKAKLSKLKENNHEKNNELPKDNLENLMKTVGLEDTMVIPKLKNEEDILGK